ncbi:MAG TPA: hypothetical protein VJ718_03930 [Candidatus Binataceae bacterium]|nr:hypothetical protein [Candidatus Binataceae bacterium]
MSSSMNVDIAIVYDRYLFNSAARPSNWIKVGEWRIADPKVSERVVSFYGVGAERARLLGANLEAFSNQLPRCVTPLITNPRSEGEIAPAKYSTAAGESHQGK